MRHGWVFSSQKQKLRVASGKRKENNVHKKQWSPGQGKSQCWLCSLTLMELFWSSSQGHLTQSTAIVTVPPSHSWRREFARNALICGPTQRPNSCCTMTMRQRTPRQELWPRSGSGGWKWFHTPPPYKPDLVPCDFTLFPKLKSELCGRRFGSVRELKDKTSRILRSLPQEFFKSAVKELAERWGKCVQAEGNFFEGAHLRLPSDTETTSDDDQPPPPPPQNIPAAAGTPPPASQEHDAWHLTLICRTLSLPKRAFSILFMLLEYHCLWGKKTNSLKTFRLCSQCVSTYFWNMLRRLFPGHWEPCRAVDGKTSKVWSQATARARVIQRDTVICCGSLANQSWRHMDLELSLFPSTIFVLRLRYDAWTLAQTCRRSLRDETEDSHEEYVDSGQLTSYRLDQCLQVTAQFAVAVVFLPFRKKWGGQAKNADHAPPSW